MGNVLTSRGFNLQPDLLGARDRGLKFQEQQAQLGRQNQARETVQAMAYITSGNGWTAEATRSVTQSDWNSRGLRAYQQSQPHP